MKTLAALLTALLLAGCNSAAEKEPTKADFSSRPPPPGWHGPDGAPSGAKPPATTGG